MTDSTDSDANSTFSEFAKNNQGDFLYSLSAITSGFGARLAEYVGVKAEHDPTVRIVSFDGGQLNKYVVNDLTTEGLTKLLVNLKLELYKPTLNPLQSLKPMMNLLKLL